MSTREATLALIDILGRGPEDFGIRAPRQYNANIPSKQNDNHPSPTPSTSSTFSFASSSASRSEYSYPSSSSTSHYPIQLVELSRNGRHVMAQQQQHVPVQSERDSGYGTTLVEPWETDVSVCRYLVLVRWWNRADPCSFSSLRGVRRPS